MFLLAQSSRIDDAYTAISSSVRRARASESVTMSRTGCKLTKAGKLCLRVDVSVNSVVIIVDGIRCSDILRDELDVTLVGEKVQTTVTTPRRSPHSFPSLTNQDKTLLSEMS